MICAVGKGPARKCYWFEYLAQGSDMLVLICHVLISYEQTSLFLVGTLLQL